MEANEKYIGPLYLKYLRSLLVYWLPKSEWSINPEEGFLNST